MRRFLNAKRFAPAAIFLAATFLTIAISQAEEKPAGEEKPAETKKEGETKKDDAKKWTDLFDGKTLKGWKVPNFGGQGEVYVKEGAIIMETGSNMTGITFTGKPMRDEFEIRFEAKRINGSDFFGTITFPVDKKCCSFVLGGWGGGVVGLSNVDFYDAADNTTTNFYEFKDKTWYKVRVRVSKTRIQAWIGDKRMVNQDREGHKFGIRDEVDLCQPLGISTWCTTGAVRKIQVRKLEPGEDKVNKEKEDELGPT